MLEFSAVKVALTIMSPNLLCWPITSEVNFGGMALYVEHPHHVQLNFIAV